MGAYSHCDFLLKYFESNFFINVYNCTQRHEWKKIN